MNFNIPALDKDKEAQAQAKAQKTARKNAAFAESRTYHADLIADLDIPPYDFQPKQVFYDPQGRQVVGIFANEFTRKKGLFIELTNSIWDPIDLERTVYRIAPNENFQEEYQQSTKFDAYMVPIDELQRVDRNSVAISKAAAVTSSDAVLNKDCAPKQRFAQTTQVPMFTPTPEDAPYSDMTIRDYYAMLSGKPVSLKPWLNELIKSK